MGGIGIRGRRRKKIRRIRDGMLRFIGRREDERRIGTMVREREFKLNGYPMKERKNGDDEGWKKRTKRCYPYRVS